MKKNLFVPFFLLILTPSLLHAADIVRGEKGSITISEWFSFSDSWWEISGGDPGDSFRSRLDYNKNDSLMTIFDGRLVLSDKFAVVMSYGYGYIDKGEVTDTDWITSSAYGLNDLKFSESRMDGRGDTTLYEIGGSLLLSVPEDDNRVTFYFGYMKYEDAIGMTNGVQTYVDNRACAPLGNSSPCFRPVGTPLPGLNSKYDFQWEFFKFGIEGDLERDKFGLSGGIFYLYLDNYRGEAYWNLRAGTSTGEFRLQPPNFVHTSEDGDGLDAHLSASYNISPTAKLLLGYRYFSMKVKKGTDTTFFSPATCGGYSNCFSTTPLDTVEAVREGPYVSVDVLF